MSRLPGGALLVVVALVVLWVAITGRLDRLATAWAYLRGDATAAAAVGADPSAKGVSSLGHVVDPAAWHVGTHAAALPPLVAVA